HHGHARTIVARTEARPYRQTLAAHSPRGRLGAAVPIAMDHRVSGVYAHTDRGVIRPDLHQLYPHPERFGALCRAGQLPDAVRRLAGLGVAARDDQIRRDRAAGWHDLATGAGAADEQ